MKANRRLVLSLLVGICLVLIISVPKAFSQGGMPTPDSTAAASTDLAVTALPTQAPTLDIAATATQIAKSPHETITSADGRVTLLIPKGALPANTPASAIAIRPLKTSDSSLAVNGQAPLVAYQMLPDGLQFTTPALIRITLDKTTDTQIPTLATISGQMITPLSPSRVEVDPKSGKKIVIAAIAHFSSVVAFAGYYSVTLTVSGDPYKVIGDSFTANVKIDEISHLPVAPGDKFYGAPNTPGPNDHTYEWSLAGSWSASSAISPFTVILAPGNTKTGVKTLQNNQSFSCISMGTSQDLVYTADIHYNNITYAVKGSPAGYSAGQLVVADVVPSHVEIVVTSAPFSCNYLVTKFAAKFVQAEFVTHYTATAKDPDGMPLTYEWSNTNDCGTFKWTSNSPEAVWLHPDDKDQGKDFVKGPCPDEIVHPGTIKVEVKSKLGADQIVQYFGGSGDGTMVQKSSR